MSCVACARAVRPSAPAPRLLFFLHFMSKQFQFKLVLLGVSWLLDVFNLIPIAIHR